MPSKEETAQAFSDAVLSQGTRVHKIFEPQWNARADVLKTIVSLSSGSIVLSVTFSSSLRTLKLGPSWNYLMVFAFAMLLISLIIAFIALWTGTRIYEIQSAMFEIRPELKQAYMAASSPEELMASFDQLRIQERITHPITSTDRCVNLLLRASSVCFCLAIAVLAIVGVKQFLS